MTTLDPDLTGAKVLQAKVSDLRDRIAHKRDDALRMFTAPNAQGLALNALSKCLGGIAGSLQLCDNQTNEGISAGVLEHIMVENLSFEPSGS